jgi:hypothetical protein
MSYKHLPSDWQDRSLRDPQLAADVLDLFTDSTMRRSRALVLIICDRDGRALTPVVLYRPPSSPTPPDPALRMLFGRLRHLPVVLGVARPGPLQANEADRQWRRAADAAAQGRCELLGCYVVGELGVAAIPEAADGPLPEAV